MEMHCHSLQMGFVREFILSRKTLCSVGSIARIVGVLGSDEWKSGVDGVVRA